jgi:hypothetical protein
MIKIDFGYRKYCGKETWFVLCLIAQLGILCFGYFGPGGYRELRRLRLQYQELRVQVGELRRDMHREHLPLSSPEWERMAREKSYSKEGNIIPHEDSTKQSGTLLKNSISGGK